MRRTGFLPALLVLLLSACNENLIDTNHPEREGKVSISLSADERVEIVSARSGAENSLPRPEDFRIEIVNSENVKFYREAFVPDSENESTMTVALNEGDFTLMAKCGDSLGFGFNKPFYMAKRNFTVEPAKTVSVEAVAKLANVKVAVDYGDQIKTDYDGFYTIINHEGYNRTFLKFSETETRPGYLPGGNYSVTVYAPVDGELKCFTLRDSDGDPVLISCEPNDFITFNINTGISYGGLVVGIKIDNGTKLVEKHFEVPADAVSELKPRITLSSFDEEGNFYVTEGKKEKADDLSFTYKAYAGVKSCVLEIDNDYMESLGISTSIDFAAQTPEQIAALEDKGFFWAFSGGIGVIDLSKFVEGISDGARYEGRNSVAATFKLTLTDANDVTISKTAKILVKPDASAVITIQDYDVWATKLADAAVTFSGINASNAKVQYSSDKINWYDYKKLNSNAFHTGVLTGLEPDSSYYLRVLYDEWLVVSDEISFTTEKAEQLGNAGFEDWTTQEWDFSQPSWGIGDRPMKWYQPWVADQWWDSNATVTLRSSLTIGYTYFKSFPCVHWSSDAHSGTKSAQLTTVNVGNENSTSAVAGTTGAWRVGELFIGQSNGATDLNAFSHFSDGHEFSARPSSMTFWYEYVPNSSSDFFTVEMDVRDSAGNVIAKASATGSSASEWKSMTLPLSYVDVTKKAASVYVSFKSSGQSSHSCKTSGEYLEIAGQKKEGDPYRIKLSATLRIDDIQLNY